ncbi:MAG: hypothetical protein HQ472_01785, partial [Ignavibacteria bacterium]|nr:hypothetical protein [Ignavibacteria bacterium]
MKWFVKIVVAHLWLISSLCMQAQTYIDEGRLVALVDEHRIESDNPYLWMEGLMKFDQRWIYDIAYGDADSVIFLNKNYSVLWTFPLQNSTLLLDIFQKDVIGSRIEVVAVDKRRLGVVRRFIVENGQLVESDSLNSDKFIATRVATRIVRDDKLYTAGVNYNNPNGLEEVWLEVVNFNNEVNLSVKVSTDTTQIRSAPTGIVVGAQSICIGWTQEFPRKFYNVNFAELDKLTGEILFATNMGDSSVYDYYDAKLIYDTVSNCVFVHSACWNRTLGRDALSNWTYSLSEGKLVDSAVFIWPRGLQAVPWTLFTTPEGFASSGWYADLTFPGAWPVENSERGLLLQFDHYGKLIANYSLQSRRPTFITSAVRIDGGYVATFKDNVNGPFIGYLDLVTSTEGPIEDSDAEGCGPTEIIAWDCVDVLGRRVSA